MFLASVRVSSQYFPVWIVYHTVAQERDRSSRCGYWLAVDIFQFWIVYRTVRNNYFMFLARVSVSSQNVPVSDLCHTVAQERDQG